MERGFFQFVTQFTLKMHISTLHTSIHTHTHRCTPFSLSQYSKEYKKKHVMHPCEGCDGSMVCAAWKLLCNHWDRTTQYTNQWRERQESLNRSEGDSKSRWEQSNGLPQRPAIHSTHHTHTVNGYATFILFHLFIAIDPTKPRAILLINALDCSS